MLKKGSAAAKAFMAKIRAKKGKKPVAKKNNVKKVGALPVGFEGKVFETTFKIINQFDIFNNVQSIVEDKKNGSTITVFDGKGNAADNAKQFSNYVENYAYPDSRLSESDYKALYGKTLKFSQNMQNEVKAYNKGSKETIKKQPLSIPLPGKKAILKTPVKQTGASNKAKDQKLQALPPGKRKSASGKTYYEYRANRSDKGKLLGINKAAIFEYKVSQGGKYYVTSNIPMKGAGIVMVGNGSDHKRGLPTYLFTSLALKKIQKILGKENTNYIESDF